MTATTRTADMAAGTAGEIDLFALACQLREIAHDRIDDETKIERLLPVVAGLTRASTTAYLSRVAGETALQILPHHLLPRRAAQLTSLRQQMQRLATVACSEQKTQAGRPEPGSNLLAIAVPIGLAQPDEALAVTIEADDALARQAVAYVVQTLQLVAAFIVMWRGKGDALAQARQAELLQVLFARWQSLSPRTALKTNVAALALTVQQTLPARCVAIGLRRGLHRHCRLMAVSGKTFDGQTQLARHIEECMNEAILVPPADDTPRTAVDSRIYRTTAFEHLVRATKSSHVVAYPLAGGENEVIGCLLAFHDDGRLEEEQRASEAGSPADLASAATVEAPAEPNGLRDPEVVIRFASRTLDHLRAGQPSLMARVWRRLNSRGPVWKRPIAWGSLLLLTLAALLPMPYRVSCNCELQPIDRRYVGVPYDGRLEAALVEPGDLVKAGQILARMDGHEIEWELGTLDADLKRALKERDTAMAGYDRASAQMSALEAERLQWKIRLLQERLGNLELKSPIDGIVIGGDPQKSVGARLSMGQTIVEVGPLDNMLVELKIHDEDVPYVLPGQPVALRLHAHPLKTYQGTISRIHPRSEDRDSQNVFIAEMEIDNVEQRLRPGMEGRAKIAAGSHRLGWNLFHKAWESLLFRFGW